MPGDYNSFAPHQNIQSLGGQGFYGYNNQGGSGTPVARGELDAIRIGTGSIPSAMYPDGYLGTIRSRRDDRLLDSLKTRVGDKSYQRGVHKGEQITASAYFWTMDFSNKTGIQRQMQTASQAGNTFYTARFSPDVELTPPPHLVNDGKANLRHDAPGEKDSIRARKLSYLTPRARIG